MPNQDAAKLRGAIEKLTGPLPPVVTAAEMQKRLEALVGRPVRVGGDVLTLRRNGDRFWVETRALS